MQWYRRGRGRVKGLCDDAKLRKKVDLGLDEKKAICCRVRCEEFMSLFQRGRESRRWSIDNLLMQKHEWCITDRTKGYNQTTQGLGMQKTRVVHY